MNPFAVLAAATARELSRLRGCLGGSPIGLVETGIGGKHLADRLDEAIDLFHCDRILLVGICGGIDPALKTGQNVIPGWVSDPTGDLRISVPWDAWPELARLQQDSQDGIGIGGDLASAARMFSAEEKQRLHALRPGVHAVDLESLAFARFCQGRGLPWAVLKTIADPMGMELPIAREMALLRLPGDLSPEAEVSDRFYPFQNAVEEAIENNARAVLSLFGETRQGNL